MEDASTSQPSEVIEGGQYVFEHDILNAVQKIALSTQAGVNQFLKKAKAVDKSFDEKLFRTILKLSGISTPAVVLRIYGSVIMNPAARHVVLNAKQNFIDVNEGQQAVFQDWFLRAVKESSTTGEASADDRSIDELMDDEDDQPASGSRADTPVGSDHAAKKRKLDASSAPSTPLDRQDLTRGIYDRQLFFNKVYKADPTTSGFIFRNLNVTPFDTSRTIYSSNACTIIYIISDVRRDEFNKKGRRLDEADTLKMCVGEMLAPYLPETSFLARRQSEAEYTRLVTLILANPLIINRYVNGAYALINADRVKPDGCLRNVLDKDIPEQGFSETLRSAEDASLIMMFLAANAKTVYTNVRGKVTTAALVSFAKRGIATEDWLNRIKDELDAETGCDNLLTSKVLSGIFKAYGKYLTAETASLVFQRWTEQLPSDAVRTRVIIAQAAKGGLTAYFTIVEALTLHPDFEWDKLNTIIPNDMKGFEAALDAIGSNVFYGYNQNMGAFASTRYKSLAYVAKEILIKTGTQSELSRYGGWTKKPYMKGTLDDLVTKYLDKRNEELTAAGGTPLTNKFKKKVHNVCIQQPFINRFSVLA
ncbi:MAG: hypothetical protein SaCV1_gp3 [Sanya chuvirus 1]|nr:MAG: hypothetical protein SaCV1_gp3 [Sanya chuvirus 1]